MTSCCVSLGSAPTKAASLLVCRVQVAAVVHEPAWQRLAYSARFHRHGGFHHHPRGHPRREAEEQS